MFHFLPLILQFSEGKIVFENSGPKNHKVYTDALSTLKKTQERTWTWCTLQVETKGVKHYTAEFSYKEAKVVFCTGISRLLEEEWEAVLDV